MKKGKLTDVHMFHMLNAYIESFNGSFRNERLNVHWFMSWQDAHNKTAKLRLLILFFIDR